MKGVNVRHRYDDNQHKCDGISLKAIKTFFQLLISITLYAATRHFHDYFDRFSFRDNAAFKSFTVIGLFMMFEKQWERNVALG